MAADNDDAVRALNVFNINMLAYGMAVLCEENQTEKRRFWVRDVLTEDQRKAQGFQKNFIERIRLVDRETHLCFFRMSPEVYDELLQLVRPMLFKPDTKFRKSITPEEKLSLTLRYLASGDMQNSLSFAFRLGKSTTCKVIKDTCEAIWTALSQTYLSAPKSSGDWIDISTTFEEKWNLPHCLGALDGKHIIIECPPKSGTLYFNYKKTFSIVLMAICDAKYRFTMVDIGAFGSQSDSGVFSNSSFGRKFNEGKVSFPAPNLLPNSNLEFPYFIVGDEAFPLSANMMRPYGGRGLVFKKKIFNYRLSRARRVIENAFGILSARWRIFRKPIKGKPENIDGIVKAAVCLHNFLIAKDIEKKRQNEPTYVAPGLADREDANGNLIPGQWRAEVNDGNALQECNRLFRANRHSVVAGELRDKLAGYLCNEGTVPWQEAYVNRG